MIILLRKKTLISAALCLLAVFYFGHELFPVSVQTFSETASTDNQIFVVDPGHGGEDGGAVSTDGVLESHLNLAIAFDVNDMLQFLGYQTVMTRREDKSIYSDGAKTLREKKNSDLENRAELINSIDNAILISIHQNSLPSVRSVHGAQVFYAPTDGSKQMAQTIQSVLNTTVNIGNQKRYKAADPSVYLMKNVHCPAILVECGFMSNATETMLLQQEEYQKKIALSITAGTLKSVPTAIKGETS